MFLYGKDNKRAFFSCSLKYHTGFEMTFKKRSFFLKEKSSAKVVPDILNRMNPSEGCVLHHNITILY